MSFWDDLASGFGTLVDAAGGDQESRDALPPPNPAVLSVRLQRILNTLLGPMNLAWSNLKNHLDVATQGYAGDGDNPPDTTGGLRNAIGNDPNLIQLAQNYLDYSQWVIPYLEAIQAIVDPGPVNGAYRGDNLTAVLASMNVTSNDFTDNTSWLQYAQPHLALAKARQAAILWTFTVYPNITFPNAAPALPTAAGALSFFNPGIPTLPVVAGISVAGLLFVGAGVAFLYFALRRR